MKKPNDDLRKHSSSVSRQEKQNKMNAQMEKEYFTKNNYYLWTINHFYDVVGMHVHCKDQNCIIFLVLYCSCYWK